MATVVSGPEVRARARYVRVAPNKARQVIAHIRGLPVGEARDILALSPKEIARQLVKVLDSAVANAENNNGLDPDDLVVVTATVDEGPTLRRFQARAMGRAYRIRKRTSHITITVAERPKARPAASARAEAGKGRRPAQPAPEAETPEAETPEAETPEAETPEAETPEDPAAETPAEEKE
jgi:large subunit ribosomal protein L22